MATIVNTSLDAAEAVGPGSVVDIESTGYRQHTAIATVSGAVAIAVVDVEVSHDQTNWAVAGTLAFGAAGCKQLLVNASVRYLRANLTELTADPGATVTMSISSG